MVVGLNPNNPEVPSSFPTGIAPWLEPARHKGFLGRLSDELVTEIVKRSQRVELPAGSVGFRWDGGPKTAIVLRGSMRSFLAAPDGSEITTRYLGPGDVTGMFAERSPRVMRGTQALEPTELLIVAGRHVQALAASFPPLAWALIEELTTVLNAAHHALYIRAVASVRQRVAITLVERSTLQAEGCAPRCRICLTQQELAVMAGTAREVTTLVLGSLQKDGIIEVQRGAVVIKDSVRLTREAYEGIGLGGH